MENYVEGKTGILTAKGIIPISYIGAEENIFNRKPEIIVIKDGELIKTRDYELKYKSFSSTYYVYKNNYCKLNCSSSISTSSLVNSIDFLEEDDFVKYSSFYLNDTWYKNITKDCVIALSLVISSLFDKDDSSDVLTRNSKVSKNYIYKVFKYFNKNYKIFFPYNKITKEYEFKSNLYKDYDSLVQILLSNTHIFKNVLNILKDIDGTRYSYKSFYSNTYGLAALLMSLMSLCGYTAKVTFDKQMFKVTYVLNNKLNCSNRDIVNKQNYVDKEELYCIQLNSFSGDIILSYSDDSSHSICIIEAYTNIF